MSDAAESSESTIKAFKNEIENLKADKKSGSNKDVQSSEDSVDRKDILDGAKEIQRNQEISKAEILAIKLELEHQQKKIDFQLSHIANQLESLNHKFENSSKFHKPMSLESNSNTQNKPSSSFLKGIVILLCALALGFMLPVLRSLFSPEKKLQVIVKDY